MFHSLKQFWRISCYFSFNPFLVIAWYSRIDSRLAKITKVNELKLFFDPLDESLNLIKNRLDGDHKALNAFHLEIFRRAYNVRKRGYADSKLDEVLFKLSTLTLVHTICRRDPMVEQQSVVVITDDILYDTVIKYTKRFPNALGGLHILRHDFDDMKPTMFLVKEVQSYVPVLEVLSVFIFDIE